MKLNNETIKIINLFENLTRARVKDCILNDHVTFIVYKGELGKAIGKKGVNIKKVEGLLKKKVRVVEFDDDVCKFVEKLLYPLDISNIYILEDSEKGKIINIKVNSVKSKAIVIGRDKKNLKTLKSIVLRYFDITDIKVV